MYEINKKFGFNHSVSVAEDILQLPQTVRQLSRYRAEIDRSNNELLSYIQKSDLCFILQLLLYVHIIMNRYIVGSL